MIIASTTVSTTIIGARSGIISRMLTRAMPEVTKRHTPTGGVIIPMVRLTATMTPKWMGSTPAEAASGSRSGVKMTSALMVSMKVPTIRSTTKGASLAGLPAHRISRLGIALVPETRGIFSYLTARKNLEIARRPGSRWPMESMLERFPKLREVLDRKGRFLSGGEQQMLAIARALLTGPELLLLDEPSQGLAPMVVETVMGTIRELKRERVSMLLVEQNAEMALSLADRVYVIDHGTIVFAGTPAELRASHQVTATYLGVGG